MSAQSTGAAAPIASQGEAELAIANLNKIMDRLVETVEEETALIFNRKLWSIFVTSATSPQNPLPAGIRQNVANLGISVFKQTLTVLADPKTENLGSLIAINRELAAGLLGRA